MQTPQRRDSDVPRHNAGQSGFGEAEVFFYYSLAIGAIICASANEACSPSKNRDDAKDLTNEEMDCQCPYWRVFQSTPLKCAIYLLSRITSEAYPCLGKLK